MSKYNREFELNPAELDLIESALSYFTKNMCSESGEDNLELIRNTQQLLGKLHNQKVFYSFANDIKVPLG